MFVSLPPFISSDDLEDYIGRTLNGAKATMAVDAACDIVRGEVGQSLALDDTSGIDQILDGTGTDTLILSELPVNFEDGENTVGFRTPEANDWTEDFPQEEGENSYRNWEVTRNGRLIRLDGDVWPKGRQNIRVTYNYGYREEDFPRDIRIVALTVAARIYEQGILDSYSIGEANVSYASDDPTGLTANEKRVLSKHNRNRT